MAITLSMESRGIGFTFPAAYVNIGSYSGNKEQVLLDLHVYATKEARLTASPADIRRVEVSVASINGELMPQLYAALKALPEYAAAQDC